MRFKPHQCPTCGCVPYGVWDSVPGLAFLDVGPSGSAEYAGETKIQWDCQEPQLDQEELVTLECENGHAWQAKDLDKAVTSSQQPQT